MAPARLLQKGYIGTKEGQIHILQAATPACSSSSSKGSVVLLHMNPSSSLMWKPILPLLYENGFEAVAMDLPGYGNTFRPSSQQFTLAFLASSVAAAIRELRLPTPLHIVGHHLGSAVAMQLAVDFPDMVTKLALWGVPIIDEDTRTYVPPPPNFDDDELTDAVRFWKLRRSFSSKPGYLMPLQNRLEQLVEMLQASPNATELVLSMDVESLLGKVVQPTLCMYGDKEMLQAVTVSSAPRMQNARLCFIPNGGLDVQYEYPQEFTSAITEFFNE